MVRARPTWEWDPWEARRAKAPPGLPLDVREARSDAKLLLFVARERMKRGEVPYDLVDRLAAAAEDPRLTARCHRMAAQCLGRIRMAALKATTAHQG